MKNLVIVESPTKAKTISKFLGREFEAVSSKGHVRDLPPSELGVDIEKGFEPRYQVIEGKKKLVADLRAQARKAENLWLATDMDREGEAIAYHIAALVSGEDQISKTKNQKFKRVVFHEITKDAIEEAFKSPRELDENLVEAQKARRVLDRLVGYKLSPLLWKKIRYNLSAGRVQSVALRFVCEREREREKFESENYWTIEADFQSKGKEFGGELWKKGGKRPKRTKTYHLFAGDYRVSKTDLAEKDAKKIIKDLRPKEFKVNKVKKKKTTRSPYPPLTTSTLQRAASSRLNFPARKTMRLAQRLYEEGLITYHRTDSRFLAQKAIQQARVYLKNRLGEEFIPQKPRYYQTKAKTAQEAHEAIRPTDFQKSPQKVKKLGRDSGRLYELIWRSTLATQARNALFSSVKVEISAEDYIFLVRGRTLIFPGWFKIFPQPRKEKELPPLNKGEEVELISLTSEKHETAPPPRYTEAGLIQELKKHEIGRPSTYAPIVGVLTERGYVERRNGYFYPRDTGLVVNDLLVEHFPKIVDVDFTAKMEKNLDGVAEGKKKRVAVVENFYEPFEKRLKKGFEEIKKEDVIVLKKLDEKCPKCGRPLVVKLGKYGRFVSCSGFPECDYSRPVKKKEEEMDLGRCPKCGGKLVLKEGKYGKFIACSNYPECEYTKPYLEKIGMKCPKCGEGEVVVKKTRKGRRFYGCSRYPQCKWASWRKPK